MRTTEQMVSEALDQRREAIAAGGKWPEFKCSQGELCLLRDQPLQWQAMLGLPERICGLKVAASSAGDSR